ncbi:MAG: ABC transporter ATP-binding protein [Desulfovibrionaceae bacterium]|nr:ABC transporter ATP-binding protein [Desulfovibrionaceae bacterium]MBF0512980.1 ABC transporter ATP-binding protein [Desulfovibrionaceae bacterium]
MSRALLNVSGLSVVFDAGPGRGEARAVDNVDLRLDAGEILALVGESGCGKTLLSLSILGLAPRAGRVSARAVLFQGRNLCGLGEREMESIRGARIGMIFQEPMTSLNPVFRAGEQIAEALRLHKDLGRAQAAREAVRLLAEAGVPDPERAAKAFPHELSGGMRQRVMIAMAVSCEPALLIADEPTTALDVTVQNQILDLIKGQTQKRGLGVLFVTHNLGVVASIADRVVVMYAGRIVERADVYSLFDNPRHPYTQGLLRSLPRPGGERRALEPIPGTVPSLSELPKGCHFHPRCPEVFDKCRVKAPPLFDLGKDASSRCWLRETGASRG